MNRFFHYISLFVFLLSAGFVKAQDPQLTQFYAAPMYMNPAFAGAFKGDTRAILNSRLQWPGVPKAFITTMASVDQNMEWLNSGVGILATYDQAGTGQLSSKQVGLMYSYKVLLTRKWILRGGLHWAVARRNIDFYKLTFVDQLNLDSDFNSTEELFGDQLNNTYFDFSSGLVLHNHIFWLGFAAHHLNEPDQSLLDDESLLPIKYTVHGGAKIPLINSVYKDVKQVYISPAFNFKSQSKYDQLDLGVYWHYDPVVVGFWYRGIPLIKSTEGYFNHDAFAILVGFSEGNFNIGYSYDITVSSLSVTSSGGSHEISLSYIFDYGLNKNYERKKQSKVKQKMIPCPEF